MTSISLAAVRVPLRQFCRGSKGRRFGINGSSTLGDLPRTNAPVAEHYERAGVLHRINGVGDVEDISRAILSALGVE